MDPNLDLSSLIHSLSWRGTDGNGGGGRTTRYLSCKENWPNHSVLARPSWRDPWLILFVCRVYSRPMVLTVQNTTKEKGTTNNHEPSLAYLPACCTTSLGKDETMRWRVVICDLFIQLPVLPCQPGLGRDPLFPSCIKQVPFARSFSSCLSLSYSSSLLLSFYLRELGASCQRSGYIQLSQLSPLLFFVSFT